MMLYYINSILFINRYYSLDYVLNLKSKIKEVVLICFWDMHLNLRKKYLFGNRSIDLKK